MRSDFAKILVERPRRDSTDQCKRSYRTRWRIDPEYPCPSAMKRMHGSFPKQLNENLRPLERFLYSRVGQKWNDVYSEICKNLDRRNSVQWQVFQHLSVFVCTHVAIVDGHPWNTKANSWIRSPSYRPLYVDPRDGILKIAPFWDYAGFELHKVNKHPTEDNEVFYCEVQGIWYKVRFVYVLDLGLGLFDEGFYDILFKDTVSKFRLLERYGKFILPAGKRQLNKREIKKLKLRQSK